jgi:hypothetical protein
MSVTQHSLGEELERDRLEHRVRRVTVAIAALRDREHDHRRRFGASPRAVRQAITEFEAKAEAMNARLRDLAFDRTPTQV